MVGAIVYQLTRNLTIDEIKRIGAKEVIIVGGEGVIPRILQEEISSLGMKVRRLGGKDRYETSVLIAKEVGVNFIGGYSALVHKGMTMGDELLIRSIPEALAKTNRVCSSINLGSTKTGINMDAVRLMGDIVKETAEYTKESDSLGCAKLVVFCNAPDDNPFMAGAFHVMDIADVDGVGSDAGPGSLGHAFGNDLRYKNKKKLLKTQKKRRYFPPLF